MQSMQVSEYKSLQTCKYALHMQICKFETLCVHKNAQIDIKILLHQMGDWKGNLNVALLSLAKLVIDFLLQLPLTRELS